MGSVEPADPLPFREASTRVRMQKLVQGGPDGGSDVRCPTSGLLTAVEPLVRAYSRACVAQAAGNSDAVCVDDRGGLDVRPAGRDIGCATWHREFGKRAFV